MIYKTDTGRIIESPLKWVSCTLEEVFNGEDTTQENFYKGSCEDLITEQEGNYKDYYGVDYSLTEKQKEGLKARWLKLRELNGGVTTL